MTQRADGAEGAWSNAFLNAVEQACETAIARLFGGVNDEKIKQALAQGFSVGVDWCCSEQFDADVAKAALEFLRPKKPPLVQFGKRVEGDNENGGRDDTRRHRN